MCKEEPLYVSLRFTALRSAARHGDLPWRARWRHEARASSRLDQGAVPVDLRARRALPSSRQAAFPNTGDGFPDQSAAHRDRRPEPGARLHPRGELANGAWHASRCAEGHRDASTERDAGARNETRAGWLDRLEAARLVDSQSIPLLRPGHQVGRSGPDAPEGTSARWRSALRALGRHALLAAYQHRIGDDHIARRDHPYDLRLRRRMVHPRSFASVRGKAPAGTFRASHTHEGLGIRALAGLRTRPARSAARRHRAARSCTTPLAARA